MRRAKKRRGETTGDESELGGERATRYSDGLLRAAWGRAREDDCAIPRAAPALIKSAFGSVSSG